MNRIIITALISLILSMVSCQDCEKFLNKKFDIPNIEKSSAKFDYGKYQTVLEKCLNSHELELIQSKYLLTKVLMKKATNSDFEFSYKDILAEVVEEAKNKESFTLHQIENSIYEEYSEELINKIITYCNEIELNNPEFNELKNYMKNKSNLDNKSVKDLMEIMRNEIHSSQQNSKFANEKNTKIELLQNLAKTESKNILIFFHDNKSVNSNKLLKIILSNKAILNSIENNYITSIYEHSISNSNVNFQEKMTSTNSTPLIAIFNENLKLINKIGYTLDMSILMEILNRNIKK